MFVVTFDKENLKQWYLESLSKDISLLASKFILFILFIVLNDKIESGFEIKNY